MYTCDLLHTVEIIALLVITVMRIFVIIRMLPALLPIMSNDKSVHVCLISEPLSTAVTAVSNACLNVNYECKHVVLYQCYCYIKLQ